MCVHGDMGSATTGHAARPKLDVAQAGSGLGVAVVVTVPVPARRPGGDLFKVRGCGALGRPDSTEAESQLAALRST